MITHEFMAKAKIGMLIYWVLFALIIILPAPSWFSNFFIYLSLAIVVGHGLEFLWFKEKLDKENHAEPMDFILTLALGLAHVWPILNKPESKIS